MFGNQLSGRVLARFYQLDHHFLTQRNALKAYQEFETHFPHTVRSTRFALTLLIEYSSTPS